MNMRKNSSKIQTFVRLIHHYFIYIIGLSYVAAALWPEFGLRIHNVEFSQRDILTAQLNVSLPTTMLALLLFNAGFAARTADIRNLLDRPKLLASGLAANILVPLAFVAAMSRTLAFWHNPQEVQQILVGLALIASMPIAGASTAWSQNANGNLALSLALVLMTTLLSPILTPFVLHAVGYVTIGDYSEDLHELASGGAFAFLGAWVILPTVLGLAVNRIVGQAGVGVASPYLKIANMIVLALLNYSNAALSLPNVVAHPDLDFLAAILAIVGGLCLVMFAAGYGLARALDATRADTASMMFGLGMNNNGTALVLASTALAEHPQVMLPVILYNLIQHFAASFVDRAVSR
ncbi:bile acid:sodium symporter [Methylocystis sp.]|uniref:bile acid:sodium symporter family protein n=1 Tax=Methylocystis sp. TaxID=1911079 RepID=UPI0025FEC21D|nr:bile acid:sodium symporter [Methylocystis sp.]